MHSKDTRRGTWTCKIVLIAIMLGLIVSVASADFVEYTTEWEILETYNVSGYVKDTDGTPIEGAFVESDPLFQDNTTDAFGFYLLELSNNTYNITASNAYYFDSSIIVTVDGTDLINQNITLASSVVPPEIISWYNDKTCDNKTNVSINKSEYVFFNVTANQTIDTWFWFKDDIDINHNFSNKSFMWTTNGTKTVKVYGTNINGTTNTITWTIMVGEIERGYFLHLFFAFLSLGICFFLYGMVDTSAWMYTNIMSTFFGGVMFVISGFMNFVGIYGSDEVHRYGEIGTLFVLLGVIAIILGILQVFKVGMDEYGLDEKEEDRGSEYEYT